jgi:two-component SAPR family response regulator
VNIVKLKTILEKIGNCAINKKSGFWQLECDDAEMYIDYKKYVSLSYATADGNKNNLYALLDIVKRGAFLAQTEYNWLDDIKSEISNFVINACLSIIKSQDISKDPESIIEITNYIFYFDKLNEDALIYKCKSLILLKRHTLANNAYQKFSKEYKDIYGEDFGKPFHEIIN